MNTPAPYSTSYCGNLCPDYIRYSPFGKWNVQVYNAKEQGVELARLETVRFEFLVDYQEQHGFDPHIFGKDPTRYRQSFGSLCKHNKKS